MRTGGLVSNYAKLSALVVLLNLLMTAACATHPKPDPTKSEVYFQNWQETEKELDQCLEASDRVVHP